MPVNSILLREVLARDYPFLDERTRTGLLMAGKVLVNERVVTSGAVPVGSAERVRVRWKKYVSRAGHKLEGALDGFGIDPRGQCCLDLGASTGGFTDCLLQRGAARVVAADVGEGLLHSRLLADPRVVVRDRCNVRYLQPADFGMTFDLVCGDLSFISLELIIPVLPPLLQPRGQAILLIKPQFEAPAEQVGHGGIVTDEAVREAAIARVHQAAKVAGFIPAGLLPSPIRGTKGNIEFLLWLQRPLV